MKTKLLAIAALLMVSGASAQELIARQRTPYYATTASYNTEVQATVVQVTPIFEQVVVGQSCVPVTTYTQQQGGSPLLGGVIGALIGSRFGGGHGHEAAIAAGAIGGTLIGSQQPTTQAYTQQQCTPVVQVIQTQNSYVAEYNGFRFSGRSFRPLRAGDKVYVQVNTAVTANE